jgi:hypothetical protein
MRELLGGEGFSDVALVAAGDAQALANALLSWHRQPPPIDPARDALMARFTPEAIGRQCIDLLRRRAA